MPGALNRGEITRLIPHREPFLLIDCVKDISEDMTSAVGQKKVRADEWFFKGHFPGKPIMPGVLIVEALAQTAAVLFAYKKLELSQGQLEDKLPLETLFVSIENTRFKKPVTPGARLELEVKEIYFDRRGISKYEGSALLDGEPAATVAFCAKHNP